MWLASVVLGQEVIQIRNNARSHQPTGPLSFPFPTLHLPFVSHSSPPVSHHPSPSRSFCSSFRPWFPPSFFFPFRILAVLSIYPPSVPPFILPLSSALLTLLDPSSWGAYSRAVSTTRRKPVRISFPPYLLSPPCTAHASVNARE